MNLDHLTYSCPVEINAYNIDKYYKANIVGINDIIDAAGLLHLRELGHSMMKMNIENHMGWALYQRELRIFRDLNFEQSYVAETTITGRHKIFTFRDYRILDQEGKVCVESSSIWLLFDLQKRNFVKEYPQFFKDMVDPGNQLVHLERPQKVKFKNGESEKKAYSVQVRNSHCDFLGHLSNNHHIRMIYDAMDYRLFENYSISQFNTSFLKEVHSGEFLDLYVVNKNDQCLVDCRQKDVSISKTIISLQKKVN